MADATIKDLIKIVKEGQSNDLRREIASSRDQDRANTELQLLNKNFSAFLMAQKAAEGDRLEKEREKSRAQKDTKQRAQKSGNKKSFEFGDLMDLGYLASLIPGMILPLTGGLLAVSAAFAGLRGWELAAIKSLDPIKLLPTTLTNGIIKLRNLALGIFGLNAEGTVTRNARGQFEKVPPISQQIRMRINALRLRALGVFGLGADGKPIALKGDDGLFKKNFIGRVTFQIRRLLNPLMRVSEGVANFATGSGAKLFKFINANILGGVKVVGGLMKRVLWPVGILFSLFEGVRDYQTSEKEGFARLGDGVGGFVGDLIGAPFDLLKRGIRWLWNNAFGLTPDENGKVSDASLVGKISNIIGDFSFEEAISAVVGFPFTVLQGMIDFVTDPEARKRMIANATETLQGWGEVFSNAIAAIVPSIEGFKEGIRNTLKKILPTGVFAYLYPEEAARLEAIGKSGIAGEEYARSRMAERESTAKKNATLTDLLKFDLDGDNFLSPSEIEEAGGTGFLLGNRELRAMLKARRNSLSPGMLGGAGMAEQGAFRAKVGREGLDLSMRDAVGNPMMSNTNLVVEGSRTTNNQGLVTGDPRPFDRIVKGY